MKPDKNRTVWIETINAKTPEGLAVRRAAGGSLSPYLNFRILGETTSSRQAQA
ncbi:MAG: hypothetical protein NT074_01475 [Methanomicrobiales archaeon]|nr:hypothetical protein [Methanomicrobiales archaeon]